MPLLPVGNVCIRRFARTFDGIIEGIDPVRYKCRATATERMSDVGDVPHQRQSGLRRHWHAGAGHGTPRQGDNHSTDRRFRALRGTRTDYRRGTDVVLFGGTLDLIARIGSHPALGEPCAPEEHVEGWFTGRGKGRFAKMTLSVILSGNGQLSTGTHAFPDASQNRVIGTLVIAQ